MKNLKTLSILLLLVSLNAFAKEKELPWFLENIDREKTAIGQMQAYLREMNRTWKCFQGDPNAIQILIPGEDSFRKEYPNVKSTSSVSKKRRHLTVILDHYIEIKEGPNKGKFKVTTLCGDEIVLTRRQVDVVADYVFENGIKSVKSDSEFWGPIIDDSIDIGLEKRVGKEKKAGMRARLDEKIPGYEITWREYYGLLYDNKESDFVPTELHLGYNVRLRGIFGVTWLNTGLVYINPQTLQIDFIKNEPQVMKHEFVHVNSNLENFPLAESFDAELLASFMMFHSEDQIDFFFHGYAALPRKFAKIYFNYDFDAARARMVKFDDATGNLIVDAKAWNEELEKLQPIKEEFIRFGRLALPEFYSDEMFWLAMNKKLRDNNVVFRMMMAKYYDPTSLGGRVPTMRWLEANKERIRKIAEESMAEVEKSGDEVVIQANLPPFLLDLYMRTFNERERAAIERHFREHPEELRKLLTDSTKFWSFVKSELELKQKGGIR